MFGFDNGGFGGIKADSEKLTAPSFSNPFKAGDGNALVNFAFARLRHHHFSH